MQRAVSLRNFQIDRRNPDDDQSRESEVHECTDRGARTPVNIAIALFEAARQVAQKAAQHGEGHHHDAKHVHVFKRPKSKTLRRQQNAPDDDREKWNPRKASRLRAVHANTGAVDLRTADLSSAESVNHEDGAEQDDSERS